MDLFERLDSLLPAHEKVGLNPGVDGNQILELKKELSLVALPKDLVDLYSWHNGSEVDFFPDLPLFGFKYYSLGEMFDQLSLMRSGVYGVDFQGRYVPIGEMDSALILSSIGESEKEKSKIFKYYYEDGDLMLLHNSIYMMVETSICLLSNYGQSDSDKVRLKFSPNAFPNSEILKV